MHRAKLNFVYLREKVGHQLIMITDRLSLHSKGLLRFSETYELNWNDSSLVQKLEETVLSVGSRLSEIHNCRFILYLFSF